MVKADVGSGGNMKALIITLFMLATGCANSQTGESGGKQFFKALSAGWEGYKRDSRSSSSAYDSKCMADCEGSKYEPSTCERMCGGK